MCPSVFPRAGSHAPGAVEPAGSGGDHHRLQLPRRPLWLEPRHQSCLRQLHALVSREGGLKLGCGVMYAAHYGEAGGLKLDRGVVYVHSIELGAKVE